VLNLLLATKLVWAKPKLRFVKKKRAFLFLDDKLESWYLQECGRI